MGIGKYHVWADALASNDIFPWKSCKQPYPSSFLQEPVYTENDELIQGYKVNVRDSDRKVLGVVTDRYKVIQNEEAFAFTDALLGEGVRYETAGSSAGCRKRTEGNYRRNEWKSRNRKRSGTVLCSDRRKSYNI